MLVVREGLRAIEARAEETRAVVRQVSAEGVRGLSAWNGGWRAHEARDVTASYGYCGISVSPQYSRSRAL